MENVTSGLVVYPAMCQKHLSEELPYMETENILMEAVAAGGDRQDLHERIRIHSVACANQIKVMWLYDDRIKSINDGQWTFCDLFTLSF